MTINMGTVLTIADVDPQYAEHPLVKNGRRLHVINPLDGYVSRWAGNGTILLEDVTAEINAQQNSLEKSPSDTLNQSNPSLPQPWIEQNDPATGRLFYFNPETGESSWDLPQTLVPTEPTSPAKWAPTWESMVDPETGKTYYMDSTTGATQWDTPTMLKQNQRPKLVTLDSKILQMCL